MNQKAMQKSYVADLVNGRSIDIIIPTYQEVPLLTQCIHSMLSTSASNPMRILVVNNGGLPLDHLKHERVEILDPGDNLGWTGGLEWALRYSNTKYVVFANDDIFVPRVSMFWLRHMRELMRRMPQVAAVGPSSNVVAGVQNIWSTMGHIQRVSVPYLIGFCMMVDRDKLEEVGGINPEFDLGDDLDLSIRLRKAGYQLIVMNDVFVYHHGFQTGQKLYGGPDKPGGWNSPQMTEETNMNLIREHGFLAWWNTMGYARNGTQTEYSMLNEERDVVLEFVGEGNSILEVGCGSQKTVEKSVGLDRVAKGDRVPYMEGTSVADIVEDIEQPSQYFLNMHRSSFDTIIARHILEHVYDLVVVLRRLWGLLREGGRLILALPDDRSDHSIAINPEHKHAFEPSSFVSLVKAVGGFSIEAIREGYNQGISFVVVLEKKGEEDGV